MFNSEKYWWISFVLACFVAVSSFLLIFENYLQYYPSVFLFKQSWPLPFSVNLCILLTSIAIILLLWRYFAITNLLAFVIFVISFWRILEVFLGMDLGHQLFFQSLIPQANLFVPRMREGTSISFFLLSLSLIFWGEKKGPTWNLSRLFFTQLVIMISFIGILGYFSIVEINYIWVDSVPIHLVGSVEIFLLGWALFAAILYYDVENKVERGKVLAGFVSLFLIALTIFFCLGLAKSRNESLRYTVLLKLNESIEELTQKFNEHEDSLERMAKRIEFTKGVTASWEMDTLNFIQDRPAFRHIYLLDKQNKIQNMVPKSDNLGQAFNFENMDQNQLQDAIKKKEHFFAFKEAESGPLYFIQAFIPLYWDQTYQGLLVAEIDAILFFTKVLEVDMQTGFHAKILHQGDVIVDLNNIGYEQYMRFEQKFNLGSLVFDLSINPNPMFLRGTSVTNAMITIAFFGGLIVSLMTGSLVELWSISKNQISTLATLRKQLQDTQYNLETSMQSAGIGAWMWNVKTNQLELDPQARKLFGYENGKFTGTFEELLEKIHPQDRKILEHAIKESTQSAEGSVKFEIRALMPNQTIRFIAAKGRLVNEKVYGSLWDISEIKYANQRLEISQEVIRTLSDSNSIHEAASKILASLNTIFGTEVLVLWLWNQKTMGLELAEVEYTSNVKTPAFEEINKQLIGVDMTIPHYVVATFRPIAIRDVMEFLPHYRPPIKSPERILSAFAFPIFYRGALTGVVELFKRTSPTSEIDEGMHNFLTTIGVSIGQFIQRVSAKKELDQLASIVTYSTDALFLVDTKGTILNWNIGAERIFGYLPDEAIGKKARTFFLPGQQEIFDELHATVLTGQSLQNIQLQIIRKNGQLIWLQGSLAPIRGEHGKVVYESIVLRDISKEKQMEDKLEAIIETAEEWFWDVNVGHIFTFSSPTVAKILGYQPEEILHKDMLDFIFEEEKYSFLEQFDKNIAEKDGWSKRIHRWKHKNGTERWLESNAEPNFNSKGDVSGFSGSNRDITENIYNEKAKNEFISLVSHELRTPLTSIQGAIGLLIQRATVSEDMKQLLEIANRNSNRLKKLIDNLLDVQKVQFAKFSILQKPVSLDKAIKESIDSARLIAKNDEKELIVQEPYPRVVVNGDNERFVQVMGNLLSNAIKFSPKHSMITVSFQDQGDKIRVSVTDQGKGIPKEFESKIFQSFSRAETGDARLTPGTGLGLSISKTIIEKCGGNIGFDTHEGVGTTFYFELPIVSREE